MKLHLGPGARIITPLILSVLIISSPLIVSAQAIGNVQNLFALFLNVLNLYVVPIIFALAFVMFLVGIYRYFIAGANDEEKVKTGRTFVMWSLIGFFLMFSVWGLINLLVGSLQLASNNEPGLPQFTAGGTSSISSNPLSAISSIFGGLLGGTTATTASNSTLTTGSTFTDPSTGTQYTMTSPTTYTAVNGSCGSTGSLIGGSNTCVANSAASAAAAKSSTTNSGGNVAPGGACTTDNQCNDANGQSYGCSQGKCTVDGDAPQDGTVQPGGACSTDSECADSNTGQSYGCYQGTCTVNGDAPQDGTVQPGGACSGDGECADAGGQSYGCNNGSCTLNGDAPGDGTVAQGGSCAGNENACSTGTCDADGVCADEGSGNGTDANGNTKCDIGTVSAGLSCVECSDQETTADTAGDCPGGGYTGESEDTGDDSQGVPSQGNTGS